MDASDQAIVDLIATSDSLKADRGNIDRFIEALDMAIALGEARDLPTADLRAQAHQIGMAVTVFALTATGAFAEGKGAEDQ